MPSSKPLRLKIDVASQRYSGFNIIVDVRDADTNEYLFPVKKDVAEQLLRIVNNAPKEDPSNDQAVNRS